MGIKVQRPRCFFDIAINNQPAGRVVFNYFPMYVPKRVRIFVVFVQVKRGQITRAVSFTELSRISWFRVVISVKGMGEEENLFMEDSLKIKVLLLSTTKSFSYQWPTEGRIQMAHSSS
ncbi:Peptidyl-prolyl cis-trans isomerase G [Lemmus lemmus]